MTSMTTIKMITAIQPPAAMAAIRALIAAIIALIMASVTFAAVFAVATAALAAACAAFAATCAAFAAACIPFCVAFAACCAVFTVLCAVLTPALADFTVCCAVFMLVRAVFAVFCVAFAAPFVVFSIFWAFFVACFFWRRISLIFLAKRLPPCTVFCFTLPAAFLVFSPIRFSAYAMGDSLSSDFIIVSSALFFDEIRERRTSSFGARAALFITRGLRSVFLALISLTFHHPQNSVSPGFVVM